VKLLFLAVGVAALWIVVASPVAHLDHHLLTAHMAQHLMLMLLAAPLVLLGASSIVSRRRPHPGVVLARRHTYCDYLACSFCF
jgi:cytochrome c oxidase assembly factor CtaG